MYQIPDVNYEQYQIFKKKSLNFYYKIIVWNFQKFPFV
jgi:hypothetical protein